MLKKLTILFFSCFCTILSAQEPIRYTTKQGLPSNHIYDIQEDADGFMWFATNRGLVKYDGETFKTFTIKDGLPNNDTWLLETDYQGKLWYFSKSNYQGYILNDSIYKFPEINNTVISPRFIHKTKEKILLHSNSGIQEVINDTIKGVGIYAKQNWSKFNDKIKKAINKYDSYKKEDIKALNLVTNEYAIIRKKEILFFDKEFMLVKKENLDFLKEKFKNKLNNLGLLFNQIFYYAMDDGIVFIDFKTKTTKHFSFKQLIGKENIKYLRCKALKNEIQVSIPGHLLTFNYDLELQKKYSFPENLGRVSYKDSKGNIWLADFTNGVSLLPNSKIEANYFLKNKKVQKISKIDSVFYAGVNDKGFYKFNKTTNTFHHFLKSNKSNGEIYKIEKQKNNYILFISASQSFIKIKNKTKQLKMEGEMTNFYRDYLKNIIQFKNKNYINSGGYLLVSDTLFNNTKIVLRKEGLLQSVIFKDNLYFGGIDGLYIKEKDTLLKPKIKNELLNVSITNFSSTTNNLFVGTNGRGVYMYNENNIIHLKNTDGYSIQKIIKKEDDLWITTNKGVHQMYLNEKDLSNSKITNSFYESDGLLQNNTNDIYLDNDLLYVASDIGIAKLNLNNKIYKQAPKLYLKTKNDTLSYANGERDNISVTFALQDFVNQDNVNYEYRLLPTHKEWVSTKTKILNFSNLSPDVYQLEVKATDQHNNQSVIKQYLKVIPKWWQTTIAKIGFGILTLLGFLVFFKIVKSQIAKNEEEKAQQGKRVAGLELQALRSQMNPHFVHNSLNAIQYFIQRNEVELSEKYLSKFSQLIRKFFEYSREQHITIKEEIELLTDYLDIEKLRFEEKLSYKIKVDDRLDTEEFVIPSMILQPIVENAVNHGLFHKKTNGIVKVEFKYLDTMSFKVCIEDDGIGINKSKQIYNKSSKNYQSKSSEVLKERLDLLNLSKEWKIEYTIKDQSEIDVVKTGTIAILTFKKI